MATLKEQQRRYTWTPVIVAFVVCFIAAGTYFALTNSALEQPWQGNPPTVTEMRTAQIQSFLIGGAIFGTGGACLTALVCYVFYKWRQSS